MRIVMDVAAAHAGRHAGAHDRADRRAGDRDRPDAELVERLDDMDMGEAAGAAAAERDGEARSGLSLRGLRRSGGSFTPCPRPERRPDHQDRRLGGEQLARRRLHLRPASRR